MTENEAIKWLKEMQNPMISEAELYCAETCYGLGKMVYPEPEDYVFEEAIQALEEIQQYRDLGTVEEILKVFNNQQAIIATQQETLKQYRAIGTIEELKELKEKSVSKKTNIKNCCANCAYAEGYTGFDDFYCTAKKCGIRAEHYGCVKFKKT